MVQNGKNTHTHTRAASFINTHTHAHWRAYERLRGGGGGRWQIPGDLYFGRVRALAVLRHMPSRAPRVRDRVHTKTLFTAR